MVKDGSLYDFLMRLIRMLNGEIELDRFLIVRNSRELRLPFFIPVLFLTPVTLAAVSLYLD